SDPDEIQNLAQDPDQQNAAQAIRDEITGRYDTSALTERILESQRRRALLKTVMRRQSVAWDHEPSGQASESYIRNSLPPYDLEKRGRFPPV
ncbi:MAG: choline-sulfatase, partial [Proteobacteria bacterium]|nr:choline-sulfatase [Pseudomonadota bacterium]